MVIQARFKGRVMMKYSLFLILGVLLISAPLSSFAAKKKSAIQKLTSKDESRKVEAKLPPVQKIPGQLQVHSLGVGLGQTFLKGDFGDEGADSITIDLYYNYAASYSFDMVANFHYSEHDFKGQKVQIPGLAIGIKSKFFQFDAFSPFALGGLGFYAPTVTRRINNELVESSTRLTFGVHMGGGVELKLNNKFSMGILAHYHNPFDVKQEDGPEVEGSYVKLLLTTLYTF